MLHSRLARAKVFATAFSLDESERAAAVNARENALPTADSRALRGRD